MNKTAIVLLSIMLNASAWSAMGTFQPDGSAFVPQNSTSTQGGRTCAAEPALSLSKGPYDGRTGVRTTKFHVESRGTKPKENDKKLSVEADSGNTCDSLFLKINDYSGLHEWQQALDSSKKFIDSCYNNPGAPEMFQTFSEARTELEGCDSSIWLENELWLQSVLYLNTTNPDYFCSCVLAFEVTPPCDTLKKDINSFLPVLQWLIQNTTCDTPFLAGELVSDRESQIESWLNDTTQPLDTTGPPLSALSLGVDTLLERHLLYESVANPSTLGIIYNAAAYPNPTSTGTVISFGISQEAYVKIEVFDILGHEVASAGFESLFEPGNKSVPMSLVGLPSGTYFARILTAYGEVQSVKVVKE